MTEWALAHPWLTFFLILSAMGYASASVARAFQVVNRTIRHLSIRKAGWPPPHVDADGDALPR